MELDSFVVSLGKLDQNTISSMCVRMSPYSPFGHCEDVGDIFFGYNALERLNLAATNSQHIGEATVLFAGEIYNLDDLSYIFMNHDLPMAHPSELELIHCLFRHFGPKGITLLEGRFIILIIQRDVGRVLAFRDNMGLMPLYYAKVPGGLILTTEVKCLIAADLIQLQMKPFHEFDSYTELPKDYSIFQNVHKVPPGGYVEISLKAGEISVRSVSLFDPQISEIKCPSDMLTAVLKNLLERSVLECLGTEQGIGICLSGGLDSSIIAALAKREREGLRTFSIGTELSDEFPFAQVASAYVGTQHSEFTIQSSTIVEGVANAVFYNEIFDALSAEIAAPFYFLCRQASGKVAILLTGYGADLLFAGTLPLETSSEEVNKTCLRLICRTLWTGEFSPYLASRFSLKIRNPYWNSRIVNMALSVPGMLKLRGGEVKKLLREYAHETGLLPKEIVYRKKIGIHEASSIDYIFARYLGLEEIKNYRQKDRFVYELFRELFINGRAVSEVDLDKVKRLSHV